MKGLVVAALVMSAGCGPMFISNKPRPSFGMAPPVDGSVPNVCGVYDADGLQRDRNVPLSSDLAPVPVKLSYDPAWVAENEKTPVQAGGVKAACENFRKWRRYVDELPLRERRRYDFAVHCKLHRVVIPRYWDDWPYRDEDKVFAMLDKFEKAKEEVDPKSRWFHVGINPARMTDEEIQGYLEGSKCLGHQPADSVFAEIEKRAAAKEAEAAEQRCLADQACVDERRKARMAKLEEHMCDLLAQRRGAKAEIASEMRYAREAHVYDLQALGSAKGQLEMVDYRFAEASEEYESLGGKFNEKRSCR